MGNVLLLRSGSGPLGNNSGFRPPAGSDLYLDPQAGTDGSGTFASPWNTLSSARLQTLVAGQALWVRQGSVAWPDTIASNSGTSGNPITVSSYPGETGTFTFTDPGARLQGVAYWDFRSLGLSCVNTGLCFNADQGLSNGGTASSNMRVIGCVGTRSSISFTDNSGIVFCSNMATSPVSIILGSYTGPLGSSANQSCLWFDFPQTLTIVGVLVDGTANPIYLKHTNQTVQNVTIKNCIVRRAGRAFTTPANTVQFINNALDACLINPSDEGGNTVDPGNHWTVSHCTFLNSDYELDPAGVEQNANNTLTNNVWGGTSRFMDNPFGKQSNIDMHNLSDYSACDGTGVVHYYRNSTQRTLAQQQVAFPTQEIHGVAGTLTLVGGTTPGATPANWALVGGSVGKGAASDGTDCGVNANNLLTTN